MPETMQFNIDSILIVDNDSAFVKQVKLALIDACPGTILLEAGDGTRAIEVFEEKRSAVIILEMMLPKRSGFLVLERIKKSKRDQPPIVIMVTGNLSTRHRVYAESLGTFQYMTKPLRMDRLCEYAQQALALARSYKPETPSKP